MRFATFAGGKFKAFEQIVRLERTVGEKVKGEVRVRSLGYW
jgi:hypothetical protein